MMVLAPNVPFGSWSKMGCCLTLVVLLLPVSGISEPLPSLSGKVLYGTSKHLSLQAGEEDRTWEFRFEVPDGDGQSFPWNRFFKTEGLLVVDQEALSQSTYYVRVRLLGDRKTAREGSLHVWLKKSVQAPPEQRPPAPEVRFDDYPTEPLFKWSEPMETLALSLYERKTGDLIYQEVYSGTEFIELWGVKLKIGGRYLMIMTQSDQWGRYSSPTNLAFRIGTKKETCPECDGKGIEWEVPHENSPTPPVCPLCKGVGTWNREVFIQEPLDEKGDQ